MIKTVRERIEYLYIFLSRKFYSIFDWKQKLYQYRCNTIQFSYKFLWYHRRKAFDFNLSKVPVYLAFCDCVGVGDPIQYESGENSSEIQIPFYLFHPRGIDTFVTQAN